MQGMENVNNFVKDSDEIMQKKQFHNQINLQGKL